MKSRFNNFNDGFITVYKDKELKTDFNAKKNIKTKDNLEFVVKLAYEECSKRQQDFDFAESNNRTLSLKVRTRFYKDITFKDKVILNDTLYDIYDLDIDRRNQHLYLYLEEVRKIDTK